MTDYAKKDGGKTAKADGGPADAGKDKSEHATKGDAAEKPASTGDTSKTPPPATPAAKPT